MYRGIEMRDSSQFQSFLAEITKMHNSHLACVDPTTRLHPKGEHRHNCSRLSLDCSRLSLEKASGVMMRGWSHGLLRGVHRPASRSPSTSSSCADGGRSKCGGRSRWCASTTACRAQLRRRGRRAYAGHTSSWEPTRGVRPDVALLVFFMCDGEIWKLHNF